MEHETVARRYAQAIFALASEQRVVAQVGKELHIMNDALSADSGTKQFFFAPVVDRKEKERVILAAFGGKAHPLVTHSLLLLVRKRREPLLNQIVRAYDNLEVASQGWEPMTVATARALADDQLRWVIERLEKLYGKKFKVAVTIDPNLIGGLRITMGDRRIDGTITGRLDELSRTLFAKNPLNGATLT